MSSSLFPSYGSRESKVRRILCFLSIDIFSYFSRVHYFSLDIEGAEFAVLKTIPWTKVDIWVISVETHLSGKVFPGSREDIIEYMDSVGYWRLDLPQREDKRMVKDDIFVKKNIPTKYESILNVERKDEL